MRGSDQIFSCCMSYATIKPTHARLHNFRRTQQFIQYNLYGIAPSSGYKHDHLVKSKQSHVTISYYISIK